MDNLAKFHKLSLHIILFQNIMHFFYFEKKDWHYLAATEGGRPPPLRIADASELRTHPFFYVLPENVIFLWTATLAPSHCIFNLKEKGSSNLIQFAKLSAILSGLGHFHFYFIHIHTIEFLLNQ